MNEIPKRIRLMPEFECWCLWNMDTAINDEEYNLDPEELPISEELKKKLSNWEDAFDKTLNQDYPPDSGFETEQEAQEFNETGWMLWEQLKKELPYVQFFYHDQKSNQLLSERP
jgi:hypothetical protein